MKKLAVLLIVIAVIAGACMKKPRTPVVDATCFLFAGDSIMAGMGPAIAGELGRNSGFSFVQKGKVSSGLCRPDFYNWPVQLQKFTEAFHPACIFFCIGTNDTQPMRINGRILEFKSKEWQNEYRRRVEEIINIARRSGADIIFVSPPIMGRKGLGPNVDYINGIIKNTCIRNHVFYIDLWHYLADEHGQYQRYDYDGTPLRAKDGVHVTPHGNRKLARAVLQTAKKYSLLPSTH